MPINTLRRRRWSTAFHLTAGPGLVFSGISPPQVEYLVPLSAARPGVPLAPMGHPKHEPNLWHLHGVRHDPIEFGRALRWLGCPAIGRSGPTGCDTLRKALDRDLASPRPACRPNASTFFPNFGTESEATVLKFARSATCRTEIRYRDHAFHRALDNRRSGLPSGSGL